MNAIASMVDKVRDNAGQYGMVTANGGYLSKHAAGIYSAVPTRGPWQRVDPRIYQKEVDDLHSPAIVSAPDGEAIIETYSVTFGRDNTPVEGIVIGRMGDGSDPLAPRFFAKLTANTEMLWSMTQGDFVGRQGRVKAGATPDEPNLFTPLATG